MVACCEPGTIRRALLAAFFYQSGWISRRLCRQPVPFPSFFPLSFFPSFWPLCLTVSRSRGGCLLRAWYHSTRLACRFLLSGGLDQPMPVSPGRCLSKFFSLRKSSLFPSFFPSFSVFFQTRCRRHLKFIPTPRFRMAPFAPLTGHQHQAQRGAI